MNSIDDFEIIVAKPEEVRAMAIEAFTERLWAIFFHGGKRRNGLIYVCYQRAMSSDFTNLTNIPKSPDDIRCRNEIYMASIKVNGVMVATAIVQFGKIMVYVKPAFRRNGFGRSLVNAIHLHYPETKRARGSEGIKGSLSFFKSVGVTTFNY